MSRRNKKRAPKCPQTLNSQYTKAVGAPTFYRGNLEIANVAASVSKLPLIQVLTTCPPEVALSIFARTLNLNSGGRKHLRKALQQLGSGEISALRFPPKPQDAGSALFLIPHEGEIVVAAERGQLTVGESVARQFLMQAPEGLQ